MNGKGNESKGKEIVRSLNEIRIGPRNITRFEKARVVAIRALQLAAGAPPLIDVSNLEPKDPIIIAYHEFLRGLLPFLIMRKKPNGEYQLIPLKVLAEPERNRVESISRLMKEIFGIENFMWYII
jgi:DNA-directed RNA polymerase subunit K/omega